MKIVFYMSGGRMYVVGHGETDDEVKKVVDIEMKSWDKDSVPKKLYALDAELISDGDTKKRRKDGEAPKRRR